MYYGRIGRRFDLLAIDQKGKRQGVIDCERDTKRGRKVRVARFVSEIWIQNRPIINTCVDPRFDANIDVAVVRAWEMMMRKGREKVRK
jgi:hypothetical protein